MQEALPYKRWEALPRMQIRSASPICSGGGGGDDIENKMLVEIVNVVKDNPIIVIGKRGCCMCHVVRKLLLGLGVNPSLFEIDIEINESALYNSVVLVNAESNNNNNNIDVNRLQFPMVFVGGRFFGGLDRVMATHLSGELVPILKQAGALWL